MSFFEQYWLKHSDTLIGIAVRIVVALILLLAGIFIARAVKRLILKLNLKGGTLGESLKPFIASMVTYLIYAVALISIFGVFGVNTASIVAFLGAAGLGVGLALKDTVNNIVAGFMILFTKPFKVGDYIDFGVRSGAVREVNLFTTTMQTFDGLSITTPNSVLWNATVLNYTHNPTRMLVLTYNITYADSIDAAKKILLEMAAAEPRMHKDPEPVVIVNSVVDGYVALQLRAWAVLDDFWQLLWEMNQRVKEAFAENGITLAVPQRELHFIPSPSLPSATSAAASAEAPAEAPVGKEIARPENPDI